MRLEGKVALVTGACGGIGEAISRRFAREGAKVVATDLDPERGAPLVEAIRATGREGLFQALDVTSEEAWAAVIEETVGHFRRLDILVNNAGIYQRKELLEISAADWDRMLDVNAKGVFLGSKAAVPAMRAGGGGSIVNISSTAGLRASYAEHYGASKGAVRSLTQATAVHHAADGIRCNSVHPGPIETQMGYAAVPETIRAERLARLPLGRFGTPEEVANAVLFLASDEASFITGAQLVVDGGATAV